MSWAGGLILSHMKSLAGMDFFSKPRAEKRSIIFFRRKMLSLKEIE